MMIGPTSQSTYEYAGNFTRKKTDLSFPNQLMVFGLDAFRGCIPDLRLIREMDRTEHR
jgi:hypothetical protein